MTNRIKQLEKKIKNLAFPKKKKSNPYGRCHNEYEDKENYKEREESYF